VVKLDAMFTKSKWNLSSGKDGILFPNGEICRNGHAEHDNLPAMRSAWCQVPSVEHNSRCLCFAFRRPEGSKCSDTHSRLAYQALLSILVETRGMSQADFIGGIIRCDAVYALGDTIHPFTTHNIVVVRALLTHYGMLYKSPCDLPIYAALQAHLDPSNLLFSLNRSINLSRLRIHFRLLPGTRFLDTQGSPSFQLQLSVLRHL
jgi:hypothetical protein